MGLPKKQTNYYYTGLGYIQLSETITTNTTLPGQNSRYRILPTLIESTNTFTGAKTTTTNTYDIAAATNTGNLTQSVVTSGNATTALETMTTTYTNYGTYGSWMPNKSTDVSITKQRGSQAAFTNTVHTYYNTNGSVSQIQDYYDITLTGTTKYFSYDAFGNIKTDKSSCRVINNTVSTFFDRYTGYEYSNGITVNGRFVSKTETGSNLPFGVLEPQYATFDKRWGKPTRIDTYEGFTSYEYDAFGRQTKLTAVNGAIATTTFAWEPTNTNNIAYSVTEVAAGSPTVKTWYDKIGRPRIVQKQGRDTKWIETKMTYDSRGNVATSTAPYFTGATNILTTTNTYDNYNRIATSVTGALTTIYTYTENATANTQTVQVTKPDGNTTQQVTDAAGKLIKSIDNAGEITYDYDSQGNQIKVSLGGNEIMRMEYSNTNTQTKLIEKNAGTTEYKYNAFGELLYQKDNKGNVYTYEKNYFGQTTKRTGPEGITTYEYNTIPASAGFNQIKKVTGLGMTQELTYDIYGRVLTTKETLADATVAQYTNQYDTYGNITQMTYPSGFVIKKEYDSKGYMTKITNAAGTMIFDATTADATNAYGQYTNYKYGNNLTAQITYNQYGNKTNLKAGTANGGIITPTVQNLNLTWNITTGNLTSRNDAIVNKTENFTYDNMDQLKTWQVAGGTLYTNTYATNGNIATKGDAGTYVYDVNKINAVTQVNPFQNITLNTQNIFYTAFQQPDKIQENGNQLILTYGADYERRKTVRSLNGTNQETRYFFGAYEKQIIGTTTNEIHYISGGNGLCAMVVRTAGTDAYYYTYTDHLGSILTLTNSTGTVVAQQNFDPWGRKRNATTWTFTAVAAVPNYLYRGYTGHEELTQFALINMNGRLYDPILGRMLSTDNFVQGGSQGYNRYTYVLNNPLKYTDPTGEWTGWDDVAAAVIGGGINLALNWNNLHGSTWDKIGQGAAYFGIGAAAGLAALYVGPALVGTGVTGFVLGAAGAAASGTAAGMITGAGNSLMNGGNGDQAFNEGGKQGMIGSVTGMVTGGIMGGIDARSRGRDFWTGSFKTQKNAVNYYASTNPKSIQPDPIPSNAHIVNRSPKRVYYKTEDGVTGLTDYVKPGESLIDGWLSNANGIDGLATMRHQDMVFKISGDGWLGMDIHATAVVDVTGEVTLHYVNWSSNVTRLANDQGWLGSAFFINNNSFNNQWQYLFDWARIIPYSR